MGERIEAWVPRSYRLVTEMTTCSGEGCCGMEHKGRWWQLSIAQQPRSVTASGTFSLAAQKTGETGEQKGVTAVVELRYEDLCCSTFCSPWERESGDSVVPQLLCHSAKSDLWAGKWMTLHNVWENSWILIHSVRFPRHLENCGLVCLFVWIFCCCLFVVVVVLISSFFRYIWDKIILVQNKSNHDDFMLESILWNQRELFPS